jgi:hypothetical protein
MNRAHSPWKQETNTLLDAKAHHNKIARSQRTFEAHHQKDAIQRPSCKLLDFLLLIIRKIRTIVCYLENGSEDEKNEQRSKEQEHNDMVVDITAHVIGFNLNNAMNKRNVAFIRRRRPDHNQ